jgi:serine protease
MVSSIRTFKALSLACGLSLTACGGGGDETNPTATATNESSSGARASIQAARLPLEARTDQAVWTPDDPTALEDPAAWHLVQQKLQAHGLKPQKRHLNSFGGVVLKLGTSVPHSQLQGWAAELRHLWPHLGRLEPDARLQLASAPNDPLLGGQWAFGDPSGGGIDAVSAWSLSTGASSVVAVLDTGSLVHQDLNGKFLSGYDFITNKPTANDGGADDSNPSDPGDWFDIGECSAPDKATRSAPSSWHGARVASLIAAVANNSVGSAGVAYNASLLPVRVVGKCGGYASDMAEGIKWAAGASIGSAPLAVRPARVINISLNTEAPCASSTQAAVDYAIKAGVTVVAAAGNSAMDAQFHQPANCNGVISVTALQRNGALAFEYSNRGPRVDIAAPGGSTTEPSGLITAANTGLKGATAGLVNDVWPSNFTGTSAAAAQVSAVVALMLDRNPALLPSDVMKLVRSSARPFGTPCFDCGAGVLNAASAVQATHPDPEVDERETTTGSSNNTKSKAQVLETPVLVSGRMATANDVDFYNFTVSAGASFRAVLAPRVAANLALKATGTVKLTPVVGRSGLPDYVDIQNTSGSPQLVYLQVTQLTSDAGGTPVDYALRVAPMPPVAVAPVVSGLTLNQTAPGQPLQLAFSVTDTVNVPLSTLRLHLGKRGLATQSACAIDLDPALGAKSFSFTGAEGRDENGQTCADLIPRSATSVSIDAWVQAIDADRYSGNLVFATGSYVGVPPPKAPEVTGLQATQAAPDQAIQGSFTVTDPDSDGLARLQILVSQSSATGPFTCALPLSNSLGYRSFSFNGTGTDLEGGRCADLLPPSGGQTTLWFFVDAVDPTGLSPLTPSVASASYFARPAAPSPVTDLTAQSQNPTTVQLNWSASPGATGYTVYRNSDILASIGAENMFIDAQALSARGNCYQVRATGPGGTSAPGNTECVTPPAAPAISDLTAYQASMGSNIRGSFRVSDADAAGISSVRILFGDQGPSGPYACSVQGYSQLGLQDYAFNGTGEDLNGLSCQALIPPVGSSRTLWVKVEATDFDGWTAESAVASVVYQANPPAPLPPSNFTVTKASVSGGGLVLQWEKSTYANSYYIYRGSSTALYAPLGDEYYFFDWYAAKGAQYCYWIKAIGPGGTSEPNGPVCQVAP